jgi:hypothetical protein
VAGGTTSVALRPVRCAIGLKAVQPRRHPAVSGFRPPP